MINKNYLTYRDLIQGKLYCFYYFSDLETETSLWWYSISDPKRICVGSKFIFLEVVGYLGNGYALIKGLVDGKPLISMINPFLYLCKEVKNID